MSEGKRPGGLTALAVLNFVFGGFSCLATLGMVALMAIVSGAVPIEGDEKAEIAKAWSENVGLFYVIIALYVVSSFLLIATGVGYLKQSRFWGRMLGNVYSVLAIGSSLAFAFAVAEKAGGGFNLGTMIGLIYPVLTLVLINTTFRQDFVR